MPDLASRACELDEAARKDRGTLESIWQDIADHVLPRRAHFTEEVTPGHERRRHILDSTAPRALELFASQLNSLLTNPARQWFRLNFDAPEANEREVRKWAEEVEQVMMARINSDSVNLVSHLHTVYLDLGAFGTPVLFVDKDAKGKLRAQAYHLQDVAFFENANGFVDRIFRQFKMTPVQARQRWPDLEDAGRNLTGEGADKDPYQEVEMLHVVFPLDGSQPDLEQQVDKEVRNRPNANFASLWVNKSDRVVVDQGHYVENPYMIPRWYKVRGDPYGRSPAMSAMPDIRMANRMKETILRGAEKLVDPPLTVPDGGIVSPVRLHPGGITFTEGQLQPQPLIPSGASRIDVGDQLLQQTQAAIREAFFTQFFLTPDSPVKTATQVMQEVDERNRALAPMLMRLHAELLQPLIRRIFGLLQRGGALPEAPSGVDPEAVQADFVSPLQSSQREEEALGVQRVIEGLLPWANFDPGVLDQFDPDEVAKAVHAGSGAPDAILRDKAAIDRLRQARGQQEQQQQQLEQVNQGAEAASKLSDVFGGGIGQGQGTGL